MATWTGGPSVRVRGDKGELWWVSHYWAKTVYRKSGVWYEALTPSATEVAAADYVLVGGHQQTVDTATAASLTAAGYGAYLV